MADHRTRLNGSGAARQAGHPFAIRPVADPRPGPVRRVLLGLGGLLATLALLVATPLLLLRYVPLGLPDEMPSWSSVWESLVSPDDGSVFFGVLAVVCWLAWAGLAASLLVEMTAALVRRPAPRIPLLGPQQWLAAALVSAIALLGSAGSYQAAVAHPVTATTTTNTSGADNDRAASGVVYVVADGDQLGAIAERFLGDPNAYPRLAAENTRADPDFLLPGERILLPTTAVDHGPQRHATGRLGAEAAVYVVADGDRLSAVADRFLGDATRYPELRRFGGVPDPDVIRPGQRLVLPADARDRGARPHATGTTQPIRPTAPTPARPAPTPPEPPAPATPAPTAPATPAPVTPGPTSPATPRTPATPPSMGSPSRPATPPPAEAPTPHPGDDGVAPARPSAPSAAGSSAPAPAPGAVPAPSASSAPSPSPSPSSSSSAPAEAEREDGVVLPSGVWVATGVAAAVSSLLLALRLHRRRGYKPRWPIPDDPADVEPTPVSITVAALETAARSAARTDTEPPARAEEPPKKLTVRVGERPQRAADEDDDDWTPTGPADASVAAASGGGPVSLKTLSAIGAALHGPGAIPAGRAILAAALTGNATAAQETHRYTIITTTATLTALLPHGRALPTLLPVHVSETLTEAIEYWGAQLASRRALLDPVRADLTGPPGTPTPPPEDLAEPDPPPLLLLVAGLGEAHVRIIRQALRTGHRYQVGAILLNTTAPAPAYLVTADGTALNGSTRATTTAHPALSGIYSPAHPIRSARSGARFSTLTEDDLAAVLDLLTTTPPAVIQFGPPEPELFSAFRAQPADTSTTTQPAPPDPEPTPTSTTSTAPRQNEPFREATPPAPADSTPTREEATNAPIELRLFGRPRFIIAATGDTISGIRSASYVLAATLTVHPDGRTLDQLSTVLAPDGDPTAIKARVRTGITSLRSRLRTAVPDGGDQPAFVIHANGIYRLDPAVITVDVWNFHTALKNATTVDEDTGRMGALRRAFGLYRGEFAEGVDQLWLDPYREEYRSRAIDAAVRLAHLLEPGHPDTALDVLDEAIAHDPLNEYLYREAMRIQAGQKRPDAVRNTLRHLEHRLFDSLAAEVSAETRNAANQYLHSS
ncbi:BTAD domain-containing putative transcriptional regulator [Cryptosporangium sp. NPDC048952]|uniref:BTAD domain-containing putative transcriptional regulator n=1 Tax=Cryptosporangium sp. NPDC048952 TaxID=3363961 RepID=UPI003710B3A2